MAGTITQTVKGHGKDSTLQYTLSCTGDASDGTFPNTALGFERQLQGYRLEAMETTPGSVTPDSYTVKVEDENGFDMLGGVGASRSTSDTERVIPTVMTGMSGTVPVNGTTTVKITGNNNVGATLTINLWFSK
jgi:hypothetical protein